VLVIDSSRASALNYLQVVPISAAEIGGKMAEKNLKIDNVDSEKPLTRSDRAVTPTQKSPADVDWMVEKWPVVWTPANGQRLDSYRIWVSANTALTPAGAPGVEEVLQK
jgi:hypothetical protein